MKQPDEIRAFKNELRNYNYYVKQRDTLKERLQNCYESLPGYVKGVDPSKEPIHGVPNKDYEYMVRDEIEIIETKISRLTGQIRWIDSTLSLVKKPLREAIISVYVQNRTLQSVSSTMYITPQGLAFQINSAIKKALG